MLRPNRLVVVAILPFAALACARQPSSEDAGAPPAAGATASAQPSTATPAANVPDIRGTDWRLVAVGDNPVAVADTQRVPRIQLQPDSKQMNGSGGCNRMFGVYELNGDALRFSGIGSTRMACPDGMDTESAFLSALQRVARWKITGQQLDLSDASGALVARLEARATK